VIGNWQVSLDGSETDLRGLSGKVTLAASHQLDHGDSNPRFDGFGQGLEGPDNEGDIARITTPVYDFYGGNDARVDATIPTSTELMKKFGKIYEPVTYDGAGHGFMRAGEAPDANEANKKAHDEA
jgi:pimeloyl-ACP methyl ester carboxylesterase